MEEDRIDPEALLEALKTEESQRKKGRLKIFLGMSAGVGKTYAMLDAAQQISNEGVDVLVGVVNTHGRQETAKLLEGLKVLPEKWITYKDTVFEEFDIDEVLRIKPKLVLIDEMAHTNVPGSRHPKRWQDVVEILDAGIDVYTTLNVQHIESRKDLVEQIAGITVRETVPDLVVETANEIELVDIPPEELLKRLKEGKVYLGPQSEIAARNFFQQDRLTALREIALRLAAEKVDHDLQSMILTREHPKSWKPRERLLVAISHSPLSQQLIRTARRLAFNLDAPLIALHVDTGEELSEKERSSLEKNLSLARDLGAEIVSTVDADIVPAIQRVAKQKKATQIIVGRSPLRIVLGYCGKAGVIDRLVQETSEIDIHIVRQIPIIKLKGSKFLEYLHSKPSSYILMSIVVALLTCMGFLVQQFIGYRLVGFVFLLSILLLSLFLKRGPILVGSLLLALIWDYFFIQPIGSFYISSLEDTFIFAFFLITAVVTGALSSRSREREALLLKKDETTQAIYEIVREMAASTSSQQVFRVVKEQIENVLQGKCEIGVKQADGGLAFDPQDELTKDDKEKAVAAWVFKNGKEAGWSTTALPSVENLYLPIKSGQETLGVFVYHPKSTNVLSIDENNFLHTIIQQLGSYLSRSLSEEKIRKKEQTKQVEKVYQRVLSSISQEFDRPLKNINEAIHAFTREGVIQKDQSVKKSLRSIKDSYEGISRAMDNISWMTTLNEGKLTLNRKSSHVKEPVMDCCERMKDHLKHHHLVISIPEDLPFIMIDVSLIELLLSNLLLNAIEYSPEGSKIEIEGSAHDTWIVLSVSDEGTGIPPEHQKLIFDKFYRLPGTHSGGVGLGLSIAKGIAELHGGHLSVKNRIPRGTIFILELPI